MERAGRNKACRILFVEPFYGGSHRQFADTLARISSHHIELVTLPARFWRWRRRLAAFEIDRRLRMAETLPEGYDLILVSDYVDIGDLRALWGNRRAMRRLPPIAWYCHETQSTYPLPKGRTVEADVVAADMRNALHADSIAFNSRFHQESFAALYADHTRLLGHWEPEWRVEPMEHKSRVIYPGVECPGDARTIPQDRTERQQGEGPIILWNHRWEYDKNFASFFGVASRLAHRGIPFRLAILGETPQAKPQTFLKARVELADRLVAFGYAADAATYHRHLLESDIVVSTAIQENFGMAIVEAMSAGCIPLLPRRLSYPEILDASFHEQCLYDDEKQMESKLMALIRGIEGALGAGHAPRGIDPAEISQAARRFCWDHRIEEFDAWFREVAES